MAADPDPSAPDSAVKEQTYGKEKEVPGEKVNTPRNGDYFPIVAIGASAGGLEALQQLLGALPAQPGMAFLLVQHLNPHHESRLSEVLGKATPMPVLEAVNGLGVKPDHVYVIPPNTNLAVAQGKLVVTPRTEARGVHLPVDFLFRSLAEDQQARAIGVVLSGTGSDGTLGLGEIKAVGGITFAQDERTAGHPGMPHSAIESGSVDFVLPPDEIGRRLPRFKDHPYLAPVEEPVEEPHESEDHFKKVLSLVRGTTGVDFSQYRDTTIRRRIMRRMALHSRQTLGEYVRLLESTPSEVHALYHDLLINVTSFFRDPEMFDSLKRTVFPEIVKGKSASSPLRLWVPGCSTGQEAYSLAIALLEFLDDKPVRPPIQIFATDLSDQLSLERARAGLYPETIEAEIPPERLRRFFRREDHLFRIDKGIRDMCVFARQNVAVDPPFSHVDLISCRNVMIYMAPSLQKRVMPTFHFALNSTGYLVLGTAETVGEFTDLFELVDRPHKIYQKKISASRPNLQFTVEEQVTGTPGQPPQVMGAPPADYLREADRLLTNRYVPPAVVVNENFDVLQYRGHTSPYLAPPPGEPTANLLKMAREGLFLELRSALNECRRKNELVRRDSVRLRDDHGYREVNLVVMPVKASGGGEVYLVLFEDSGTNRVVRESAAPGAAVASGGKPSFGRGVLARLGAWLSGRPSAPGAAARPAAETANNDRELAQMRHELAATKEYLQSLLEQQDAANEELRSANEEILSSNEELQSTNEELETAKEELQSANEELTTVNEQLQHRNVELNLVNNDLTNLLSSTTIPVVMVGSDLCIRRLTTPAQKVLNLLPLDVGRPIGDLKVNVDVPNLDQLISEVVETMRVHEQEVRDRDGHWYQLRIHPYRTGDNRIDGAVIVLLDINQAKKTQDQIREALDYAQSIIQSVRIPLIVLDGDLRVQTANKAYYEMFRVSSAETEGRVFFDLIGGQWDLPQLRERLSKVLPDQSPFEDLELDLDVPQIGRKIVFFSARGLYRAERPPLILLAIVDITARIRAEETVMDANRRKDEFLAILAHELRNPLASIRNAVALQRQAPEDSKEQSQAREILERQVPQIVRLVDDLLDVSRISEGKFELKRQVTQLAPLVNMAIEECRGMIQAFEHHLDVNLPAESLWLHADPVRVVQVLVNLLTNAAKFTPTGGKIRVTAERSASMGMTGQVAIRVRDNGIGMNADLLSHVFDLFTQGDHSLERARGGLGVGLTLVRSIVQLHGGSVEAFSAGVGHGSEVVVRFPLAESVPRNDGEPVSPPLDESETAPRRVLIVDDNRDAAQSLRMLLELFGHEVRVAGDGPETFEIAKDFVPDLALIDIGLPGMNGYDVARRLREFPGFDRVTLVANSGHGRPEDQERSLDAGFDHHCTKPIAPEALRALLRNAGQNRSGDGKGE